MQIGIEIGVCRRQGGGAALTPPSANRVAWFRKGLGITDAANAVSQWADYDGSGRNLLQATGASQPAKQGDGTILLDGGTDFMKCAAFVLIQPNTVYLRMKQITWANNDYIFDGELINSGVLYQGAVTPGLIVFAGSNGPASSGLAVDTWGSIAAVFNGASSVIQVNGTSSTAANPGAGNMGGFTLGASANGTLCANVQVAEIIIYNVAHDATQRAAVIAYLDTL